MSTSEMAKIASANDNALTAKNQFVEAANGVTYAYRRFGTPSSGTLPLVMLVHFRGNLDNWDPLLLDSLASGREVITVSSEGLSLARQVLGRGRAKTYLAEHVQDLRVSPLPFGGAGWRRPES